MTWWILGCGYTGQRLARRLLGEGEHVIGTARSPRSQDFEIRAADVFEPLPFAAGDVVVDSVPPDPARGPHAAVVAGALPAGRIVYLSSTGVYPRGEGEWVDEDTPVAPLGARGRERVVEEEAYFAAAGPRVSVVSLRIAAIYGPGRGVQERLRSGSYRVPGDGQNFVSRVHVEDLVSAIVLAGRAERLPRRVYVVGDDQPCRSREHADGAAALLGLPPPESTPIESLSPLAVELASANRRIRNTRLKEELGWRLEFPTWREGLAAELGAT